MVFGKYIKDEHNHYRVCLDPDCGEIKLVEPHNFSSNGDSCSVCGFNQAMIDAVNFEQIEGKDEYCATGYKNGAVEEIVIPDEYAGKPVTEIKNLAFCTDYSYENSPLTRVSIGKNVTKIGMTAFWNCKNLEYVICPNSLTEIGYYAFSRCENLSTVRLNKNLKTLKQEAFWGCTNLTEIAFPKTLQTVGVYAFSGCSNLESVKFNEGLKTVELGAFYGCTSLLKANLPSSLKKLMIMDFGVAQGLMKLPFQAIYKVWEIMLSPLVQI